MLDSALACRLESLAVQERMETCRLAQVLYPDAGAFSRNIGRGIAVCGGEAIGLSSVIGLGLDAESSASDVAALREFLDTVGERPVEMSFAMGLETDPVAEGDPDHDLDLDLPVLAEMGLRFVEFEYVLTRELEGTFNADPDPAVASDQGPVSISVVAASDRDEWASLVATGFCDGAQPTLIDLRFAACIARRAGAELFMARDNGVPAAAAELWMGEGVAWLSADATLPAYRRRGLQHALQLARMEWARKAGCHLAVTEAVADSSSLRNAVRLGFTPLYRRAVFARGTCTGRGIMPSERHTHDNIKEIR